SLGRKCTAYSAAALRQSRGGGTSPRGFTSRSRIGSGLLRLAAGARVRSIVDLGEVLKIKVGVHLGRRNVGVSEQFLHAAQVLAGLEQVCRKGVTEQMRMDTCAEPQVPRPLRHADLHGAR